MLSGGELARQYAKDFVIVEASWPSRYPIGHELYKLADGHKTVPLFVFLDGNGKVVQKTNGFGNAYEGRALHQFISQKLYQRMAYQEFLASFPDR
jgi:hypothetical protein